MFPVLKTEEEGREYISFVDPDKASRQQAAELFKSLDEKVKVKQARETGICPVREELYSQCFDEVIRQVTIECPERGLFLLRVRDQLKMSVSAYQTLYESAFFFGTRKQKEAEEGKKELNEKKRQLEEKKKKLEERVAF